MKYKKLYIGIDIGGTTTAVSVLSNDGIIVEKKQYATIVGKNAWKHSFAQMEMVIVKYLTKYKIASIGISCGGPLDSKEGIILSPPNLPGWDDVKIVQAIKNKFGILTYLENDANAGALAEWKFGAGKGKRNLIFLTFGTGLGAGIILDGKLYLGTNSFGGGVGHIRLADDGPIGYHKRGSFEGFCSGTGLSQMMALELLCLAEEVGKAMVIKKYKEPGKIIGRDVVEWAKSGDLLALKVVEKSGEYLGKGLSILIDILNPELIIIGSMGVRLGNLLFNPARKIIKKEALSQAAKVCKIVSAKLGEKVGDLAALCVALKVEEA